MEASEVVASTVEAVAAVESAASVAGAASAVQLESLKVETRSAVEPAKNRGRGRG